MRSAHLIFYADILIKNIGNRHMDLVYRND